MEKNNNTTNNYEQEIDILALFKVVFRAKWRILTFVVLATREFNPEVHHSLN